LGPPDLACNAGTNGCPGKLSRHLNIRDLACVTTHRQFGHCHSVLPLAASANGCTYRLESVAHSVSRRHVWQRTVRCSGFRGSFRRARTEHLVHERIEVFLSTTSRGCGSRSDAFFVCSFGRPTVDALSFVRPEGVSRSFPWESSCCFLDSFGFFWNSMK